MKKQDKTPVLKRQERFESLTPSEQRVFEEVSLNNDLGHNPRTLASLVGKGYLEESIQVINEPGKWPISIKRYEIPIPVHMRWCDWCSEHFDKNGNPIKKKRRA